MSKLKKDQELITKKDVIPFVKNQIKERIWEKKYYKIDEGKLLRDYKPYIEKRVNSKIKINSEFDPENRAIRAKPFKPALYIPV